MLLRNSGIKRAKSGNSVVSTIHFWVPYYHEFGIRNVHYVTIGLHFKNWSDVNPRL